MIHVLLGKPNKIQERHYTPWAAVMSSDPDRPGGHQVISLADGDQDPFGGKRPDPHMGPADLDGEGAVG